MKTWIPLIFLLLAAKTFAQPTPKPILFDEFGEECVESVLARRDGLFTALGNSPGSHGVVIFYGKRELEGRNTNLLNYYKSMDQKAQKFLHTSIRVERGEDYDAMKFQFWLVPDGAAEPKPERPFEQESYKDTKLFDRAFADFNRWSGKLGIYSDGFYDLGCWFSPNRPLLSKLLTERPDLRVHLVGYSGVETSAARAKRVLNFAVGDLVRNYKIARHKISSAYGGKRKEAQIEFFVVPKGDGVPVPRPNFNHGVK